MKVKYSKQIDIEDLKSKEIDLFLFGKNDEGRVLSAFKKLKEECTINKKASFCYTSTKESVTEFDHVHINNHDDIIQFLDTFIKECSHRNSVLHIVVDYSCMTKSWYYTIMLFFASKDIKKSVKLYFIYTPSVFQTPQPPTLNTEIAPLPGKYLVQTSKPKALIVCLGYERTKAEGIIEHLDPKECYILYTDPSLESQFTTAIVENNKSVLESKSNIIQFPIDNLGFLERELTSLYFLLKDDYSIIIAPLGPKPFTYVSMLMALKYHDIDIWRVGSGTDFNKYQRDPLKEGLFIIGELVFEPE